MRRYIIDHAVDDLVRIFLEEGYTEKTIAEHRRNIQCSATKFLRNSDSENEKK